MSLEAMRMFCKTQQQPLVVAKAGVLWRALVDPFFPTVPTCAVREIASLGIMGESQVPP